MFTKEESTASSRVTFYTEQSHLRRSAINKHEETPLHSAKDSYRVYVAGPKGSDKTPLIKTFYYAMQNKLKPLQFLERRASYNTVQLTPNKKYQIKSNSGRNVQLRRGTLLIQPTLPLDMNSLEHYQQLLGKRTRLSFCSQPQSRGDALILTIKLGVTLTAQEKGSMRMLILTAKEQNIGVYIVLTHLDTFTKEIRNVRDAQSLQNYILSVSKDFDVLREKIFILQCYRQTDTRLSEEANFYALQVIEQVVGACCENEVQKPKGWLCGWFL